MGAVTPSAILQNNYFNEKASFEALDSGRPRFKVGSLTAPATADDTDTITIDMYDRFGIKLLLAVIGFIQTTTDSIIVEEAPTTKVDGTSLVITVGGSTDNKKRFYLIYGL